MNKFYRSLAKLCFGIGVVLIVALLQTASSRSATTTVSPAAQVLGIATGAHIPPTYNYGTEIASFNAVVGKKLALDMYFSDFGTPAGDGKPFDDFLLRQIRSQLPQSDWPVIVLAWMPQNGKKSLGCDQNYPEGIPPASIAAGACDTYIRAFARGMKARPERFILRFAFEMSLLNSKYWPGHFGQDANDFIAMWRHVHDLFKTEGVTNVEWLWGPSFDSNPTPSVAPWNDLHNYYPGNDYVDWVGPDGYNWYYGQTPHWSWVWFSDMYDAVLKDFACRYPKPQIIHEFGSADGPGYPNKSTWIQDAFQQMPNYPFLRASIWLNGYAFDNPAYADFRVASSTRFDGSVGPLPSGTNSWTTAYKNAIAPSVYKTTLPTLAAATPPTTYCGNGETTVTVTPNLVVLEPGGRSTHTLTGMLYNSSLNISLDLPANISSGTPSPNSLAAPWGTSQITLNVSASAPLGQYTVIVHAGGYSLPIQVVVVRLDEHAYLPLVMH